MAKPEIICKIQLNTIKNIQNFVERVSKYDEDIVVKYGNYEINAKSIMGIFSLNILEPLEVCLYSDNLCTQNIFIKDMEDFKARKENDINGKNNYFGRNHKESYYINW